MRHRMNRNENRILAHTQSLCPRCLKRIPAVRMACGEDIFLVKHCPQHGEFKTRIWQGNDPSYDGWLRPKTPTSPQWAATTVDRGCPFDCGLCPEHRQHTCTALLEVTFRCNLNCPVCYADAGYAGQSAQDDPGLDVIENWYRSVKRSSGTCNIQLSGGEPTVRDDLPDIIRMGHRLDFGFIQINTNGLRLASDEDYVKALKHAGLNSVFLQFDGTEDAIYRAVRGRPLVSIKQRAIENCERHDIGVVLVPTLLPDVNTHNIGEIIRFGMNASPSVRGIHFQPISYFGRYPQPPEDNRRWTLPKIMRAIEQQTGRLMQVHHFRPPG